MACPLAGLVSGEDSWHSAAPSPRHHASSAIEAISRRAADVPTEDWWPARHIWALKVIETAAPAHMAAKAGPAEPAAGAAPTPGKLAVISPRV